MGTAAKDIVRLTDETCPTLQQLVAGPRGARDEALRARRLLKTAVAGPTWPDQPMTAAFEVGVSTRLRCSGQVKTDTQLSNQSKLFIGLGTNIPEIRMLPSALVAHLDVINDNVPCLLTRGVITM
jgi:hypothetical protein